MSKMRKIFVIKKCVSLLLVIKKMRILNASFVVIHAEYYVV